MNQALLRRFFPRRVASEEHMHFIGPHGRPLDQEQYVSLGNKYGSTDYSYYLFTDGNVWCFESPNNGYAGKSGTFRNSAALR